MRGGILFRVATCPWKFGLDIYVGTLGYRCAYSCVKIRLLLLPYYSDCMSKWIEKKNLNLDGGCMTLQTEESKSMACSARLDCREIRAYFWDDLHMRKNSPTSLCNNLPVVSLCSYRYAIWLYPVGLYGLEQCLWNSENVCLLLQKISSMLPEFKAYKRWQIAWCFSPALFPWKLCQLSIVIFKDRYKPHLHWASMCA